MPCDEAVINMEERQILIDMLKWPVCTGRDGIMLRIAELQGARPAEFSEFKEPGKRSTFHGDLRRFIGSRNNGIRMENRSMSMVHQPGRRVI
jgi:hypothetical protein